MTPDPVTTEVLSNALAYTAEEMGIALKNAAYSHNIKERMDHSCALFGPRGNLLAQAEHIPVHLGSLPWGLKNVLTWCRDHGTPFHPGDIIMANDPYIVGTHLNDMTVIKPVFHHRTLIGFSTNKAHHVDVGGAHPGSISCTAASLGEEGIVVHPTKMFSRGDFNEEVKRLFIDRVRNPGIAMGDLRAQVAAVNLGERRMLELAETYGHSTLFDIFHHLIDFGERRMRRRLQDIPSGTFQAEDCLEDVGGLGKSPGVGGDCSLIWIRVRLRKEGDDLTVSFEGTDPQVSTPLNAVFGVTLSAAYFAVKSIVAPDTAVNEGDLRPIRVSAPMGCLVNPRSPAPVSGGNLETSQRIADTVFRALGQALPGRVPAASYGSMNNVIVSGTNPATGQPFVYYETIGGGSGARPGKQGVDGVQCTMTNTMNTPIEAMEQYYPLRFEEYELRPGTGGRGAWRGGNGIRRSWTLLAPEAYLTVLGERRSTPPWGAAGGEPGACSRYLVRRSGGQTEQLGSKVSVKIFEGDTLIIETPGGGGYGNTTFS